MCAADSGGIVSKPSISRGRGIVEVSEALIASELATNGATIIDKDPVTRGRTVVEYRGSFSECTKNRGAAVRKSAEARGRGIIETCPARASIKAAPPFMVKKVPLPAVALFVNNNLIALAASAEGAATKFCVVPELLMMPAPLSVSVKSALAVIV